VLLGFVHFVWFGTALDENWFGIGLPFSLKPKKPNRQVTCCTVSALAKIGL